VLVFGCGRRENKHHATALKYFHQAARFNIHLAQNRGCIQGSCTKMSRLNGLRSGKSARPKLPQPTDPEFS
jgi:hypothetical protein